MIAKTLPALLLLALPALAAPNRPPPDNTYCTNNATNAGIRASFAITPNGGGARVERTLEVAAAQTSCFVAAPGQVELRAEQPGAEACRARRDAAGGQMQVMLRVTPDQVWGFNQVRASLHCGE